jgi:N-acetylglucosaminyldiphosphoundecaprenol N-acetyl-beta-D-mannosaminyltransferase
MRHKLFGMNIDDINDNALYDLLASYLTSEKTIRIATPNPEMIVDANKDLYFANSLSRMDLNLPDGVALRYAVSALTDNKLINRHTGIDTLDTIFSICERQKRTILLFGASGQILESAKENILKKYDLEISVLNPGVLELVNGKLKIEQDIINRINEIGPEVIVIALSHKKQIAFMDNYNYYFQSVKIMIGVGGALDMIAGSSLRAPKFMRRCGFEWLWRLLIEPTRIGRIIKATVIFPFIVMLQVIKERKFIIAIKKTLPEIFKQIFISK